MADSKNCRSRDSTYSSSSCSSASSDDKQGTNDIDTHNPRSSHEDTKFRMGVPIESSRKSLPPLMSNKQHKVFFKVPHVYVEGHRLQPYSERHDCYWDNDHVYMPNSRHNLMPEVTGSSTTKWEEIRRALSKRITCSWDLMETILSYNQHYERKWKFEVLHKYFQDHNWGCEIKYEFFEAILPKMQLLALRLPELVPMAIPILKQVKNMTLTFSQEQIACLLANAFFCTFPKRNRKVKHSKLPDINFSNLFGKLRKNTVTFEKLSCIINYFKRVTNDMPNGSVSFTRQYTKETQHFWFDMEKKFTKLYVLTTGTIEDDGLHMLQVDFANKYVGGGVLGHGLVQEEIRFLICPEMIVSRLFTEVLTDDEALIMTGCERFNNYKGYSKTFEFVENCYDNTERDEWGRRCTKVVAMDALVMPSDPLLQFEMNNVFRELNKAYCAFKGSEVDENPPAVCTGNWGCGAFKRSEIDENLPAVCTGNWGCGVFGGDKELKALIQMMAASAAGRDICYITKGDYKLCEQMGQIYDLLKTHTSVGDTLNMIKFYHEELKMNRYVTLTLFEYIAKVFGKNIKHSSTDQTNHAKL